MKRYNVTIEVKDYTGEPVSIKINKAFRTFNKLEFTKLLFEFVSECNQTERPCNLGAVRDFAKRVWDTTEGGE
jgi:hypothetical protein